MIPEYNYRRDLHYLHVSVSGNYLIKNLLEIFQNIKNQCAVNSIKNVLFDLSFVEGNIPLNDKYKIGEYIADVFSATVKMALVDKKKLIDKLGEDVAVNRGAKVAVFTDQDQALQWLIGKK